MFNSNTNSASHFINQDVAIRNAVLKRRFIKGQYKAIIEAADGVIWLQACKNGVMATSTNNFEKLSDRDKDIPF